MKICTICARGGSKGVKGKNVRLINGKPLISYSIKQALNTHLFDLVAVSSDSQEILDAAQEAGAGLLIKRPDELATDSSSKLPAIRHAFLEAEKFLQGKAEILVDLDCTSPLRTVEDIKGAVDYFYKTGAPNVITGALARRSPYFNMVELMADGTVKIAKGSSESFVRRQDVPVCYDVNASIYIWSRDCLINSKSVLIEGTRLFEMPHERSIDIDSELDFKLVSFLMSERGDLC